MLPKLENCSIAIIGLGYVGLPLALKIAEQNTCLLTKRKLTRKVYGFDINKTRIEELKSSFDRNNIFSKEKFKKVKNLKFVSNEKLLENTEVFIITVPTPINIRNEPNLSHIKEASRIVGNLIKHSKKRSINPIIIYESTVFPGLTEDICVPIIEKHSNKKYNSKDYSDSFYCGYSPERINPGDNKYSINSIVKVTSGCNEQVSNWINKFYGSFIKAGTFNVSSIKIAEAAKIIENTQRDINIALINELALIFNKLDIDTESVLEAAGTKWNFLPFRPGMVGGHCIGIDPYYLTHKAIEVGYHPEIILAGRKLNDSMSFYVVDQISKLMIKKELSIVNANVLIMGLAFKENCPDIRNSKVVDLVNEFSNYNCKVDVYDPWIDKNQAEQDYSIKPISKINKNYYDVIVIAVAHKQFQELTAEEIKSYGKENHVLFDIKYVLSAADSDGRL